MIGVITVAIQAGGRSSRMGRDKALAPLAGKPLIAHVLDRVAELGDEILITTNDPEAYAGFGVRLVADAEPGGGALQGLQTALAAARGEIVLVLACDIPFVCRPLLGHMLTLAPAADVVVPRWHGEFEPLHAVYAQRCLGAVEAALRTEKHRMISFFHEVRVRTVEEEEIIRFDPEGLTFFNVNSPEDLAQAESILRAGGARTMAGGGPG